MKLFFSYIPTTIDRSLRLVVKCECLWNLLFELICFGVRVMVFNTTFNNMSVISWRSVLLVEETGVPGQKPPTRRKWLTNFIT